MALSRSWPRPQSSSTSVTGPSTVTLAIKLLRRATASSLGIGLGASGTNGRSISTQELAQQALKALDNAIISKDKIRAHLGALQNRLENTITNLTIQSENTSAAESQISDVDVATEMTEFTRQQIKVQTAVAMLSQANSLGKLALQLIGG